MTDEDTMMRVGSLLARAVVALGTRLPHHRRPYAVSLRGADAARLMASMRDDLGAARQGQIARALADWAEAPTRRPRIVHQLVTDRPAHDAIAECEIAWLAGLLEGEGSFTRSSGRGHTYPVVSLEMSSRDIVERAARILGAPSVTEIPSRNALWSATYRAGLSGAGAVVWMQRLRPLMGARRRAAIDDALDRYYPVRLVEPPSRCVVEGCTDAPRARGLCHRHYMSWSRDVARGRAPRVKPLRSN